VAGRRRLDKLASVGGNYTRCLVSGRLRGEALWPFLNTGERFDLDRWDENYWQCFQSFLVETKKRGIITDIELWATFDYARVPWTRNPFNPVNNRNYTAPETGLPAEVKSPAYLAENPFYRTVPDEGTNPALLRYQKRFVDKVLSYTLRFDNVLYCMDNETAGGPAWGAFWARYVRKAADRAGKKVFITEMFEAHDLEHPSYRNVTDDPRAELNFKPPGSNGKLNCAGTILNAEPGRSQLRSKSRGLLRCPRLGRVNGRFWFGPDGFRKKTISGCHSKSSSVRLLRVLSRASTASCCHAPSRSRSKAGFPFGLGACCQISSARSRERCNSPGSGAM